MIIVRLRSDILNVSIFVDELIVAEQNADRRGPMTVKFIVLPELSRLPCHRKASVAGILTAHGRCLKALPALYVPKLQSRHARTQTMPRGFSLTASPSSQGTETCYQVELDRRIDMSEFIYRHASSVQVLTGQCAQVLRHVPVREVVHVSPRALDDGRMLSPNGNVTHVRNRHSHGSQYTNGSRRYGVFFAQSSHSAPNSFFSISSSVLVLYNTPAHV